MDEVIKTPYDRKDITIAGEIVSSRPVEWNGEMIDSEGHLADGSLATPIKYETVCPKCSQMIHYEDKYTKIQCPECKVGDNELIYIFVTPFCDPGAYVTKAGNNLIDDLVASEDIFNG